jgi:hypothetical protein
MTYNQARYENQKRWREKNKEKYLAYMREKNSEWHKNNMGYFHTYYKQEYMYETSNNYQYECRRLRRCLL